MKPELDPIDVLAACAVLSSLAGVAAQLRSNQKITGRYLFATFLHSGLMGLAIGLVWYNYFAPSNILFLIGISILAGLGGASIIDVAMAVLSKSGVTVNIRTGRGGIKDALEESGDDND